MFEGLNNGELEIGQVSSMIKDIIPVSDIMFQILQDFQEVNKIFRC